MDEVQSSMMKMKIAEFRVQKRENGVKMVW